MPNTPFSTFSLDKVPQELYLFFGGISGGEANNFDPLADSFFAARIPETQKRLVANVSPWQANKTYKHYSSTNDYDVVRNDDNGIVYLCLHNNINFRDDSTDGEPGLSIVAPSHNYGRQTYSDGYTWLPLWKVDFTDYEFISNTEFPIPSLSTEADYNTFTEKYEPLCGSGVTAFGCCCLYFKENSVDEVTGEVYTKGDVTNETIFSDCYECQKLADALDRDVTFLSGVTTGGINDSHPLENPLCPATKTILTLKDKLNADKYNIIPGSSKEYQLELLNNYDNQGIMSVAIDLSGLSEAQRTITSNSFSPIITINDAIGSGAYATLKTIPVGADSHYVYGIELNNEGTNYSLLPTVSGTSVSATILNAIHVYPYPDKVYEDLQIFTPAVSYKARTSITNAQLASVLPVSTIPIFKAAIAADPIGYANNAPVIKTKNSADISTLLTQVRAFDPTTFSETPVPEGLGGEGENVAADFDNTVQNPDNSYEANIASAVEDMFNVEYEGISGSASGYILYLNDDPASFKQNDMMNIGGVEHIVYSVTAPSINVKATKYYNTIDFSTSPIEITGAANQTTTKAYTFNIILNNQQA